MNPRDLSIAEPHGAPINPKWAARRLAKATIRGKFEPEALHAYTNEAGTALYWRIRARLADGEKWIRPMRHEGIHYTLLEPPFDDGKPLYRLHELATHPGPLWYVEGESCADALAKLGVLTTTAGSASSDEAADFTPLAKRTVTIWPDNDQAGIEHAERVAQKLAALGCNIEVIDAKALDLSEQGDCVNWLRAHPAATVADLATLPRVKRLPASAQSETNATAGRIAYRRASEIEAIPIRWLWRGRIARGKVSMLAGNPGLGKSQVTASMAAIVSTAGIWPVDRTRCDRGSVVILSAEDDAADTLRPRLEAAGADLSRVILLDAVIDAYRSDGGEIRRTFNLKNDLPRLCNLLSELKDVALVVIDPITAYLGDTDSHKNADIRALLAPLADIAAKHSAAVVCVSHLNKGSGTDAMMRVTGSLAFVAAARAAFLIAKDQENDSRRLFLPIKNNIGNDQTGLAFRIEGTQIDGKAGLIETSRVTWDSDPVTVTANEAMAPPDDPAEHSAIEDAKAFLVDALKDGSVPAKRIYAEGRDAGHSERTLRRAQKALGVRAVKEGMTQPWLWELPVKMANRTEDVQGKDVDAFAEPGHLRPSSAGVSDDAEVF